MRLNDCLSYEKQVLPLHLEVRNVQIFEVIARFDDADKFRNGSVDRFVVIDVDFSD